MANMKIKHTVFNIDDPDQEQLLNHAELRKNFSAYIKRLIQRDMEGGNSRTVANTPALQEQKEILFNAEGFV